MEEDIQQENHAKFYEERLKLFTEDLQQKIKDENVEVAALIIRDPKIKDQPLILVVGHNYNAARLSCVLARALKQQLFNSDELIV